MSEPSILRRPIFALLAVVTLSAGLYLAERWGWIGDNRHSSLSAAMAAERTEDGRLLVESRGVVVATLPDGTDGGLFQRWTVRIRGGKTLTVSHDLGLAPRVPLRAGDDVAFRGELEWTRQGGVVHSTHRDPTSRTPGGWIRHEDKTFR